MYLNLASYQFTDLDDLPGLRQSLLDIGQARAARGTILLAPEGINLVVSALVADAQTLMAEVRALPGLAGLEFKESRSPDQSFNRFLVKIKAEIIAFRQPGCTPQSRHGDRVSPDTLARWLDRGQDDDGREIALIDTRNGFEIDVGRFEGAFDPGITSFGELPEALTPRREQFSGKRIVTYCTGGIRCEKAVLWMEDNGFDHVVQLDGGILRYFETVGARHWQGELFVFDRRTSLTPDLQPGNWEQDFETRQVRPTTVSPTTLSSPSEPD